MRSIMFILLILLAGLQYKLWIGTNSIRQWSEMHSKIKHQQNVNEKMLSHNEALSADIVELKSGEQALEERARNELGMVKDEEIYYHFVESDKNEARQTRGKNT